MKIISKFHDYYDSAAAYGVSDVYFKRSADISYHKDERIEDILHNAACWGGTPGIILFCGTAHAVINLQESSWPCNLFIVTKPEDIDTYRDLHEGHRPGMPRWPRLDPLRDFFKESYANRGFEAFQQDVAQIDAEYYHREFMSPIIWLNSCGPSSMMEYQTPSGRHRRKVCVVKDACLKDLNFQKVKDAFTAYQEIDSYLSGVLGVTANPTVQISDTHRLEGHGFDKRTSFRNMKR